ncbi:MAG TPA: YigZ family protein [Puia sp.]|nr:YigZ family protein [Puia sp.]
MDFYNTIEKQGMAEYKDRGSRFIACAYPLESKAVFKSIYQAVKSEHPKATHHCFAYRLGTDNTDFRVSDDGEPSGTAGRPILGQIDSKGLTNILIVVVRYFGGTLLGVPGLINAYKTAASFVLQVTPSVQKKIEVSYRIQFDYTRINEVMTILKLFGCTVISREMQLFCVMEIGIPRISLNEVKERLIGIPHLELGPIVA